MAIGTAKRNLKNAVYWINTQSLNIQSFLYYYQPYYTACCSGCLVSETDYHAIVKMSYLYVDGINDILYGASENLYSSLHGPGWFAHYVRMSGPGGVPSGDAADRVKVIGLPYSVFNSWTKVATVLAI